MEARNFSPSELKLLNTNKAIKVMLEQGDVIDAERALRFVNYERELEKDQVELVKLQTWVIENKKRVCILYEGRDAAGKGGAIRRFTHHLNPRLYSVEALPKPTIEEKGTMVFSKVYQ